MLTLRNKIKNLDANVMLKTHEWVQKKKAIQTWLYNHSQSHSQWALIKYGGSWTLRKVVMHHQKKSINKVLEEAGIKQGSEEMIKSYQKAIDTVMKSLTAEEIQQAKALATEWNEWQPPWEVQTAEKKGHKYAEQFAKEMWKCCGTRVVVMAAWKDADGEVIVGVHDFNDELGNGKLFEELDKCQDKFVKQRKSNGKPKTILPVSDNGTPYILDILDMQALQLKDIMWRNSQATVPWSVIMTNTALYIAPQFLPPEVPFKELSQLTQDKLTAILEWWQDFKKWRDAGGSLQMLVAVADSSGARMGAKQDLDGSPDHLAVVGSDSDDESNLCQIPPTLPSNRNDGTGTSMVDEDTTEAVALLDSQQQIAGCQGAEGDTCQPIAIGKEPPHAWQQVVCSNTSPVQPMPEGYHTDSPDSLHLADPWQCQQLSREPINRKIQSTSCPFHQ
ncbi:hypothetical protein BKA82DRAFT_4019466 [Pisolithus tinctorius]|nr:hypothetical protein BKA82DRAFT_4019466 [Pisolithus tinctorius]